MFRISIRALTAIVLVLLLSRMATADTIFNFIVTDQYNPSSDNSDRGYGWLAGNPSGLNDGSYLLTSGSITFTETDDKVTAGTWSLITSSNDGGAQIGPYETLSPIEKYDVDNLLYPDQNANLAYTSGIYGGQPSYLTQWGLLFGNENNSIEINIWGNLPGQNNYSFYSSSDGSNESNADPDETFILTSGAPAPGVLPASLSLLCLSGLGLLARRRFAPVSLLPNTLA